MLAAWNTLVCVRGIFQQTAINTHDILDREHDMVLGYGKGVHISLRNAIRVWVENEGAAEFWRASVRLRPDTKFDY